MYTERICPSTNGDVVVGLAGELDEPKDIKRPTGNPAATIVWKALDGMGPNDTLYTALARVDEAAANEHARTVAANAMQQARQHVGEYAAEIIAAQGIVAEVLADAS
jgi:hypothetical protein